MPVEHSFVWQQTNLIIVSIRILSIHRMLNNNIQLNANQNGGMRTKWFSDYEVNVNECVCVLSNIWMKAEAQDLSSENCTEFDRFCIYCPEDLCTTHISRKYMPIN